MATSQSLIKTVSRELLRRTVHWSSKLCETHQFVSSWPTASVPRAYSSLPLSLPLHSALKKSTRISHNTSEVAMLLKDCGTSACGISGLKRSRLGIDFVLLSAAPTLDSTKVTEADILQHVPPGEFNSGKDTINNFTTKCSGSTLAVLEPPKHLEKTNESTASFGLCSYTRPCLSSNSSATSSPLNGTKFQAKTLGKRTNRTFSLEDGHNLSFSRMTCTIKDTAKQHQEIEHFNLAKWTYSPIYSVGDARLLVKAPISLPNEENNLSQMKTIHIVQSKSLSTDSTKHSKEHCSSNLKSQREVKHRLEESEPLSTGTEEFKPPFIGPHPNLSTPDTDEPEFCWQKCFPSPQNTARALFRIYRCGFVALRRLLQRVRMSPVRRGGRPEPE